jgi:speckle-type POZ protein
VTAVYTGIQRNGLLINALQLSWKNNNTSKANAVETFRQLHPDLICNFQIIIEIPGDEYEAKGLKFIRNNLSKFLGNESFADIRFVFKDDQVPAHSAIIAASSPVFAAMFEGERFKESQTRTVDIEDIDSRVFRKLLQFLYTGSSGSTKRDPPDELQALFLAADKYQVEALREICEEYLICQLKIESVIPLLVWAHQYGAENLKYAAVAYAGQERYRVWKLEEWEELSRTHTDLLYQVCNQMVHYQIDFETSDDDDD